MLDSAKRAYWDAGKTFALWRAALLNPDRDFRAVVRKDLLSRRASLTPIDGEVAARAAAAAEWLIRAQDASPDDGVSYGYFPTVAAKGWEVSYPETTGYIITSLIEYARRAGRPEMLERVYRMALWEVEVQMPSGAVQGGKLVPADRQTPASFNTGMVLDGWVSLLAVRDCSRVAAAAERAAGFLAGEVTERGVFRSNGAFVTQDAVKIYNVLCAWALYRHGEMTGQSHYRDTAVRVVEGALKFQAENGWIADNCLTDPRRPLTHTIGYSAQGILEVGVLAGREDFIAAAEKCFQPLMARVHPNGYLPGRFDSAWRPAVRWSCLTGSAQVATLGYRLCELRGEARYGDTADLLVNFLKVHQKLDNENPGILGALAGAFPILGDYMAGGYPNWATKYLLDALMHQAARSGADLGVGNPG